ncbi:MAG: hypothetical protein JNJ61_15120 [Anaerolineae bacterium]|nr:hypothetical protein [Anaerolineae bacterium]
MARIILSLLIGLFLLAGCAMADVPTESTPHPALTVAAPPAPLLTGSCETTRPLESWLQVTTRLLADYQTRLNEAAGKTPAEAYTNTTELIALRDAAYQATAPDCAADAHTQMTTAMDDALLLLQGYINGSETDINASLAELNTRLEAAATAQSDLLTQLNTQLQEQRP